MNSLNELSFPVAADTRAAIKTGTIGPTDLVDVSVDPDMLIQIYNQMGHNAEYLTAQIHQQIKAALFTQLQDYMQTIDINDPNTSQEDLGIYESVAYVATNLGTREATIDPWVEDQITAGRTRLTA
jgi:hypothetical protein